MNLSDLSNVQKFEIFISSCKDVLLDRIKHACLFYFSNLVANNCFLFFNPHKYHVGFKRDRLVEVVVKLIELFVT